MANSPIVASTPATSRMRVEACGVPPWWAASFGISRTSGGMTKNGTSQKTARQVTESASQPATRGPTSDGTTHAADSTEKALGRTSTG